MLKSILIDDELGALSALETILTDFFSDRISVIATASSALEGIKKIQNLHPDIVFLDVEMQGGSGFDILEAFPERKFKVIFVTAYEEYALRALKMKAYDYILKPVDLDEMEKIIGELITHNRESLLKNNKESKKICLPTLQESYFVEPDEIVFIRADGRYSEVILTSGKKIFLAKNLGSFEEEFSLLSFLRVHKSFLINLNHIKGISNDNGWNALMSNDVKIEISRKKIAEVKSALSVSKS